MGGLPGMLAQQLTSQLAGRQATAGTPAVATGMPPGSGAGQAVARQLAELKGADPKQGEQYLKDMVSKLASMINTYALRVPGAAQSLARALPSLQRALKEIQQASQTMSAVGGPMNTPAAPSPNPSMGGGAPSAPAPGGRGGIPGLG